MYDDSLHRQRKHFCCYYLQFFNKKKILKRHFKDFFKINDEQTIKMPKKEEYIKFIKFERKIKSPFIIYDDFETILVPEDNGKQNPNEFFINKYQYMLLVVIVIS